MINCSHLTTVVNVWLRNLCQPHTVWAFPCFFFLSFFIDWFASLLHSLFTWSSPQQTQGTMNTKTLKKSRCIVLLAWFYKHIQIYNSVSNLLFAVSRCTTYEKKNVELRVCCSFLLNKKKMCKWLFSNI